MTQTRGHIAVSVLIAIAVLDGCTREEAAERSMLRIGSAKTDIYTYIEKPEECSPSTECTVFKLDAGERYATEVKVQFGEAAGDLVRVRSGLRSGDKVILSDMSAYKGKQRIRLQR